MKVTATSEGSLYGYGSYDIEVDGRSEYRVHNMSESPEDACMARDIPTSEVFSLMKRMYEAGKRGEEVTFEEVGELTNDHGDPNDW